MNQITPSRTAAATGAVSAVALFVANGQGGDLAPWRDVVASAALTLLVAFAGYLAALIRRHSDRVVDAWVAATVLGGAAVGVTLKLASGAPEQARHALGATDGTPTAMALQASATALTTIALFPLALFCLAAGAAALRNGILPRWLGAAAVVTSAALAINGCFMTSESVPALPLLLLWCLAASIYLVRKATRQTVDGSAGSAVTATTPRA